MEEYTQLDSNKHHFLARKTAILEPGGAESGALAQILALLPGLTPEELDVIRLHLDGMEAAS